MKLLETHGDRADWVVVPDIVAGGMRSLEFSLGWMGRLTGLRRLLLPVQDGMTEEDVRPHLSAGVGIFVGGSTDWKWSTVARWAALARSVGCYCHVGRVNTERRILECARAGADSFDGGQFSMFPATYIPRYLDRLAWRQQHLLERLPAR